MKSEEIKGLTTKELIERIDDEKSMLVRLRLNHTVSPLDNPHKLTIIKRNIARLNFELDQRKKQETIQK
jgi:large subunit ribosomal protein L29